MIHRYSAIFLSLVAITVPAAAANLLLNPDFDLDLTAWDTFATWSGDDWEESLSSGSATIINNIGSTSAIGVVSQCVNTPSPKNGYRLSGYIRNPEAQSGAGYGKITIIFFSTTDCDESGFISGWDSPEVQQTGVWEQVEVVELTPDGTQSIRVDSYLQKIGEPGEVQVYVDHMVLEAQAAIFSDDFETGDTDAWSETVPPVTP